MKATGSSVLSQQRSCILCTWFVWLNQPSHMLWWCHLDQVDLRRKFTQARRVTLAPQKGDLSADSTFCFAYKPFTTFCKEMFEGLIDLQPGTSISRGLKGTIPEHKMATVKGYFTMFNPRLVTPFWPKKMDFRPAWKWQQFLFRHHHL